MLPDSFKFELVTPERRVVQATVVAAQIPASEGYIGVLPGHAPLLGAMGMGELSYRDAQGTHYAAVFGGYVEVLAGRVIVLAETAERAEEISADRARASRDAARKILATPGTPEETAGPAREAVARADIRLKVAEQAAGASARSAEAVHSA
jgi:F-type H+-transporting ATPase subunit epsilon